MRSAVLVVMAIVLLCGCDPKGKYHFSTLKETDEMLEDKKQSRLWSSTQSAQATVQPHDSIQTD